MLYVQLFKCFQGFGDFPTSSMERRSYAGLVDQHVCFDGVIAPSTLACIRVSPLPTAVSGNYDYDTRVGCPDLCFWESRYVESGHSVGFGAMI